MFAEKNLAEHDDPDIQGRFVGIRFPLVGKGEQMPVAQRFVGDAQVAQFVRRREIAQDHDWQHCQQKGKGKPIKSIFLHGYFCVRERDCGHRPRTRPTGRESGPDRTVPVRNRRSLPNR